MTERFDPHIAANPFERRIPELPDEATDEERRIAAAYTRISYIIVPDPDDENAVIEDATIAWFVIDQQSWRITAQYKDTREGASWHCWMLAKALLRLIAREVEEQDE